WARPRLCARGYGSLPRLDTRAGSSERLLAYGARARAPNVRRNAARRARCGRRPGRGHAAPLPPARRRALRAIRRAWSDTLPGRAAARAHTVARRARTDRSPASARTWPLPSRRLAPNAAAHAPVRLRVPNEPPAAPRGQGARAHTFQRGARRRADAGSCARAQRALALAPRAVCHGRNDNGPPPPTPRSDDLRALRGLQGPSVTLRPASTRVDRRRTRAPKSRPVVASTRSHSRTLKRSKRSDPDRTRLS